MSVVTMAIAARAQLKNFIKEVGIHEREQKKLKDWGVIGAKDDNVRRRVKTEKIRRAKGDRKEKFGIVLDNCLRVTMFFTTGLKV